MYASAGSTASENVRHYFARLALQGNRRDVLERWSTLSVETFFVALRLPESAINIERRSAAQESPSLGLLFANVRWE